LKEFARRFEQTDVDSPWRFSLADWWAVIKRTLKSAQFDNVTVIAAGVAFFSLLAIFPLISAALSIFSYFATPGDVQGIINNVASLLPAEAYGIIEGQVVSVLNAEDNRIGLGIILPIAIAIFSAGTGIRAMMRAMNVAYEEVETRNILVFYIYAGLMTLGSFAFVWISLLVIIGAPTFLSFVRLDGMIDVVARTLPWVLLISIFCFACGIMYRFGPARRPARKRWIFPGIGLAMMSWIGISFGFSIFVAKFSNYNEVFGGLASVIILLIWFWLTATVVILGAELNSELERQTIADTTRGPFRALGDRGAAMADFVAKHTPVELAQAEMIDDETPPSPTVQSPAELTGAHTLT